MRTVYDLLGEYKCFLETYHSERCKSFHELCCTQPEAARAEAVVFSFFQWNGYDIRVEETGNEGGVDFRVQTENTDFVVEVTSIGRKKFTEYSGAPEKPISGKGHRPNLYKVADQVLLRASSKARQMSDYPCPRLLVIACEHPEYVDFLHDKGAFGPKMLLTSPLKMEMRYDPENYTSYTVGNVTDLAASLFFKFQDDRNDRIVFCRKSISAVLLFHIHERIRTEAVGLLHPKPAYNFSIELLPSVPFVEVLVPGIENYSAGDSYNIEARWIPDNLPDGLFRYD